MKYVGAWIAVVVEALIIPALVACLCLLVLGVVWLGEHAARLTLFTAIGLAIFGLTVWAAIKRVREAERGDRR
jgi:hypothetical protein